MKKSEFKEQLIDVADYIVVLLAKLTLVFVVFTIIASLLICNEIKNAKDFCESADGKYEFNIFRFPEQHLCSEKPIFNYKSGWNWDISNKTISLDDISIN